MPEKCSQRTKIIRHDDLVNDTQPRNRGATENAAVENAGVEIAGVDRTGGKCRSGKCKSR